MCEYQSMAKYYDLFYSKKSYSKEVEFITDLIGTRKTILDVGCGTGIHMKLLEDKGYRVDGMDLSENMLDIAKSRTKGHLFCGNLLDYKSNKTYDVIISMFAVFNHLQNYKELEKGIKNLYNQLNTNGILIIDLHNGRTTGEKEDTYQNCKRIMKWTFDHKEFKEYTNITYIIDNKTYYDHHKFTIYEIEKLEQILNKNNLKYELYENYSLNSANNQSKNIQIIITK